MEGLFDFADKFDKKNDNTIEERNISSHCLWLLHEQSEGPQAQSPVGKYDVECDIISNSLSWFIPCIAGIYIWIICAASLAHIKYTIYNEMQ
jgi:hypothetical protein